MTMTSTFLRLAALVVGFVLLTNCWNVPDSANTDNRQGPDANVNEKIDPRTEQSPLSEPLRKLNRMRELWRSHKISDYDFEMSLYVPGVGTPPWPVDIRVRGGRSVSITPKRDDDRKNPYLNYYDRYRTVEQIFSTLEEEFRKSREVSVEYESELGFPSKARIVRDLCADCSWSFEVVTLSPAKREE